MSVIVTETGTFSEEKAGATKAASASAKGAKKTTSAEKRKGKKDADTT